MTHRDFDQERLDRLERLGQPTFRLGGYDFTLRDDVRLDVLTMWDEFNQRPDPDAPPRSQAARVAVIDQVWTELLVADDAAKYAEMRARPDSPGVIALVRAAEWAVEEITSRPFEQSSASGPSPSAAAKPAASTAPALRVAVGESDVTASGTGST
jgi:hypothetical protein